MSKKIGIITLSASDNCGSLLQAYALQEYLQNEYGAEVDIINLVTEGSLNVYSIFPRPFFLHPKKTLFAARNYTRLKSQRLDYENFRENYLNMTEEIVKDADDLKRVVSDRSYDVVISGSDQIWNTGLADFSDCFFLKGDLGCQKAAYAASLGSLGYFQERIVPEIGNYLQDYSAISVREPSGALLLSETFNIEPRLACDPTLLHDELFWKDVPNITPPPRPYIFFYSWAYLDSDMNKLVQEFSKDAGLPVFVINPSKWYGFKPDDFGFTLFEKSGPEAFLSLMANAEYVFVQSFHGIVLANIMRKNYCFLNEQYPDIDFRAGNILSLFGQENRIASTRNQVIEAFAATSSYTNEELDALIAESKEYLDEIVGGR